MRPNRRRCALMARKLVVQRPHERPRERPRHRRGRSWGRLCAQQAGATKGHARGTRLSSNGSKSSQQPPDLRFQAERAKGIEPSPPAWKAGALPLSYAREAPRVYRPDPCDTPAVRIPFIVADVFTDRALAGNQLMVVPDAAGIDGDRMLALAREIGFSESTFVAEADGDRYRMRIFTPEREMGFAGHPTLGTAFVLATDGRIGTSATQTVP